MSKIFAFCNQKGGVGKTTTATNISYLMSLKGHKVLLIDLDSQGNATSGLGEEKPTLESTAYQLFVENFDWNTIVKKTNWENLFLIRANFDLSGVEMELVTAERREFKLKKTLDALKKEYDFIFIDCPPSLGLVTINILTSCDNIIIPIQCEYYALEGLGQLLHTFQLVKTNLNPELEIGGVLLTMADVRTNLTQQVIADVRNFFKEKVFNEVIPRSVKLSEAPSFGKPAILYDPSSRGSQAYFKVGEEFEERFSGQIKKEARDFVPPAVNTPVEEQAVASNAETSEPVISHGDTPHENKPIQKSTQN